MVGVFERAAGGFYLGQTRMNLGRAQQQLSAYDALRGAREVREQLRARLVDVRSTTDER